MKKKLIDPKIIQQIKDASQIVEVIQDFITLRRAGVNYKGNCPFHNEKTPSFTVSPAKGIYKCFGCGASGDSAKFVMEHEKISYPEAIKYLGKKFNIAVPEQEMTEEVAQEYKERESLFLVNEFAKKFFVTSLHHSDEGKGVGLAYFRERGFREDIIKKFELGWSPAQRDALTQNAKKSGYKNIYLEKLGLSITRDDGSSFDRFAGRVMFPILSLSGKTIAFGGRILRTDKNTAKYLNSPESELYHKSDILYGIYFAKNEIVKRDKCFLVEGYTDVISMVQSGVENVVASSGTALTENQVKLIKRFTSNLTILYDGDAAGIKASLRGFDIVLSHEINVKAVLLPAGEDPDSFSRKLNSEEFRNYIEKNEQDFIQFKTKLLAEEVNNDPVKRSRLISSVVESISIIPDKILRAEYIKETSKLLKTDESVLYEEVRKKILQKTGHFDNSKNRVEEAKPANALPAFVQGVYSEANEREVLYFLLNFGDKKFIDKNKNEISAAHFIISEIQNEELDFQNLIYKQIFEEYQKALNENTLPSQDFFLMNNNPQIQSVAGEILGPTHELSKIWKKTGNYESDPSERLDEVLPQILARFKFKILESMRSLLVRELEDSINGNEKTEEIFGKLRLLDDIKIELTKEAGERIIL